MNKTWVHSTLQIRLRISNAQSNDKLNGNNATRLLFSFCKMAKHSSNQAVEIPAMENKKIEAMAINKTSKIIQRKLNTCLPRTYIDVPVARPKEKYYFFSSTSSDFGFAGDLYRIAINKGFHSKLASHRRRKVKTRRKNKSTDKINESIECLGFLIIT